jgi:hypothetical protein
VREPLQGLALIGMSPESTLRQAIDGTISSPQDEVLRKLAALTLTPGPLPKGGEQDQA